MNSFMVISPAELANATGCVVVDCRFSLADPDAGRAQYQAGHIPGACYLDLNRDLSAPPGGHGGRHPLPDPAAFSQRLAQLGIAVDTPVIAYDDSGFAYAARLWWLLRALGYQSPRLLDGGYQAWLAAGGEPEAGDAQPPARVSAAAGEFAGYCNIEGLRAAMAAGALLVDSREPRRYQGLEEPIDPVAGHIPGAINRPWQSVTDDQGRLASEAELRQRWGDALAADELVVYCGSGVTACVNLFSLAVLGRDDARLYAGSWSDWCSYL